MSLPHSLVSRWNASPPSTRFAATLQAYRALETLSVRVRQGHRGGRC
jgi:hypothetical protein